MYRLLIGLVIGFFLLSPWWSRAVIGQVGVDHWPEGTIDFTFSLLNPPPPPPIFQPFTKWCDLSTSQPHTTVKWNSTSNTTNYTVKRADYTSAEVTLGTVDQGANPEFQDVPPLSNQMYWYIIEANGPGGTTRSENGTGYAGYSASCPLPAAFNFTSTNTRCRAVNDPVIDVGWEPSTGAVGYAIFPQLNPAIYYYPTGLAPSWWNSSGGYLEHVINPYQQANGEWDYNILAYNSSGGTWVTGGSSYYHFGWIKAKNCANPVVDLKIDGTDLIKTVRNGSSIQLTYTANNSYTLTSTTNPVVTPLTTPWSSLYPLNTVISNPWSTTGAKTLTLYNNSTYPYASYQFTLTGTNPELPGSPTDSRTVTVNVTPDKAPYLQTTQGDVHSNKNISVPQ